jgi:signal transduction histidine kinase
MTAGADGQTAGARTAGRAGQTARRDTRLIDGMWAGAVLIAVAGAALTALAWSDFKANDAISNMGSSASTVAYASLGALIVRRVRNPIGWLLMIVGVGIGMISLVSDYAVVGIVMHPGALPAAEQIGAVAEWVFFPVVAVLAYTLLLFPTGTLPSRRWRPAAVLNFLATGLLLTGFILLPRPVALPAPGGYSLTYQNPFGIPAAGRALSALHITNINSLTVLSVLFLGAAAVSLVLRYRAGGAELRRQINWVALAGVAFAVFQLVAIVAIVADHGKQPPVAGVAYAGTAFIGMFGLPAAITVAILKYRLYEIDVIINRTVVYGLVSAGLTAVYAGIVLGIGALAGRQGGPVLTVGAAVAVALLFQPVRERARRIANRLVYGERATPYQVLSDFAESMAGQLDYDKAVDRMVTILAGATGATRAEAWIRVGAELRPVTTWPGGSSPVAALPLANGGRLPAFGAASRAVAVRHGDELLGALTLHKPRNEPLTLAEDKLLQHLASQAGLVFRNRRLTAELQATIEELKASRRRLVKAQDTERRKIERNLHDGAQQQLVALSIQLSLLEQSAEDADCVRQLAPQLKNAARAAADNLRDLARGIYPPLLADQGLVPALQAQARKAALPVTVEASAVQRYPQDAEATVYFCALEALQNITKYAGASRATVHLSCSDGSLQFTITDDGTGFDTATTRDGTGLQGMADRLAALGGTLHIRSQPGHGTTVTGRLPVHEPAAAGVAGCPAGPPGDRPRGNAGSQRQAGRVNQAAPRQVTR